MVCHVDILNGSRAEVVARIAGILRCGEPSPFAYMGACRHGLRIAFIELGHRWKVSDTAAENVVLAALDLIGAQWPSWQEGQPDFCQHGTLILRQSCLDCGEPLLNDLHAKFCNSVCRQRWHGAMARRWLRKDGDAYRSATRTVRGLDEQHNMV